MNNFYERIEIDDILNKYNFHLYEGHCEQTKEQADDLKLLSKDANLILEIGFNAGHSSNLFLNNNPNCKVISFDLCIYNYTSITKQFIDKKYPNRHILIAGNTLHTLPSFFSMFDTVFDFIFIDGGHNYDISSHDIINCIKLSNSNTIVVIDDIITDCNQQEEWNIGVTKFYTELKEKGGFIELGNKKYKRGIGMCWGKFNFDNIKIL